AHSSSTPRSATRRLSESRSSTSSLRRRRRCSAFCASCWSVQKSGAAMRASSASSSPLPVARSKIAPQVVGPTHHLVRPPNELVLSQRHCRSPCPPPLAAAPRDQPAGRQPRHDERQLRGEIPDCPIHGATLQEAD